ncbi:hypothetical protein Tco_0751296 [Tanacetum coccineum]|uniref:Uncharacterized protein n=1 Tax=Tanacetum coccineum TaxID=301880 RepID=A0ABQ4Z4L1_9ASTR
MLISRVTGKSESLLKTIYISGLKPALQCALLRSNHKTLNEAFSLARATEARFTDLQLWELLRSNPTTLGEAFFRAQVKKDDEDIGVDEVSSAIDGVFDIGESSVESIEVRSKFDESSENKENRGGEFDDSLDEINLGLSEEFVIRVLEGRDVPGEKSREVFSVMPLEAKGRRRVLCYVQGSRRRKRKKSVGYSNGRRDCALFGALVFPLFNPGPSSFAHKRIWDPGIKIFLDDTFRARWFRRSGECYALGL